MGKIKIREDILRIKSLISEPRNLRVQNQADEFLTQLQEMGYRLEEIEKKLDASKSDTSIKRQKQIIAVLKSGQKTATDAGKLLGISRTRASEYLKELEKDNLVLSERVGRKKYYFLRGDVE